MSTKPGQATVPPSLELSIKLWFAAAALFGLRAILEIVVADDVNAETLKRFKIANPGVEASVTSNVIGVIFSLALVGAWVATVLAMRSGHNWARILLTVLGGVGVVIGVASLAVLGIYFTVGGLAVVSIFLLLLSALAILGAIIMQFRPDAKAFFVRS